GIRARAKGVIQASRERRQLHVPVRRLWSEVHLTGRPVARTEKQLDLHPDGLIVGLLEPGLVEVVSLVNGILLDVRQQESKASGFGVADIATRTDQPRRECADSVVVIVQGDADLAEVVLAS